MNLSTSMSGVNLRLLFLAPTEDRAPRVFMLSGELHESISVGRICPLCLLFGWKRSRMRSEQRQAAAGPGSPPAGGEHSTSPSRKKKGVCNVQPLITAKEATEASGDTRLQLDC